MSVTLNKKHLQKRSQGTWVKGNYLFFLVETLLVTVWNAEASCVQHTWDLKNLYNTLHLPTTRTLYKHTQRTHDYRKYPTYKHIRRLEIKTRRMEIECTLLQHMLCLRNACWWKYSQCLHIQILSSTPDWSCDYLYGPHWKLVLYSSGFSWFDLFGAPPVYWTVA